MKLFSIFLMLFFASTASAFDQMRKGAFMGFGAGVNNLKSDLTIKSTNEVQSFNDAGMSVKFKLGSGVIKKVALHSDINHRHFLSQAEQGSYFITDLGVGAQFYMNSYVRTFYGLGSVSTAVVGFSGEKISLGRTFRGGVGYEFLRSWQFELSFQDTDAKINHTLYDHLDSQSVQFTINYLWY